MKWSDERIEREAKRWAAIDRGRADVIQRIRDFAAADEARWCKQLPAARWANGPEGILVTYAYDIRKASILDELQAALYEPGVDPLNLVERFRPDIDVHKTWEQQASDDALESAETAAHNAENSRRHANGTWTPGWWEKDNTAAGQRAAHRQGGRRRRA